MKFHKPTIFLIVGLFFSSMLQAQKPCSFAVRGVLYNTFDSSAIAQAELFIETGHYVSKTNSAGQFEINKLCAGKYLLEIDVDAHTHVHYDLVVNGDTFINLFVNKNVLLDSLINITALDRKPIRLVERDAIENLAGSDLSTLASTINGIRMIQNGQTITKPMAQGMYGLRLPIFIDGIKMEGQQWGDDHAPEADALGFDRLEWLRDASILLHASEGSGGVLNFQHLMEFHPGEKDWKLGTGVQSNGAQLNLWGMHKKADTHGGGSYLQFSTRKSGNLSTPNYNLGNTGLQEIGFQLGRKIKKSNRTHQFNASVFYNESGILDASHISNVSDLKAAINRGKPLYNPEFTYKFNKPYQSAAHLNINYLQLRKKSDLSFSIQYNNRREFDFHRSRFNSSPQLDLNLLTLFGKQIFKINNTKFGNIEYGYASEFMLHKYLTYYFIPDFKGIQTSVFGLTQKWFGALNVKASLRYEVKYLSATNLKYAGFTSDQKLFSNYAAALSVSQKLRKVKLDLDLIRTWRNPWVNELYSAGVHHGNASYEKGNANLKTEIAYKIQGHLNWKKNKTELDVLVYAQYFKNFILLAPDSVPILTVRGAFPSYVYRQFDALYMGSSITLSQQIGQHLKAFSDFDFIYARNLNSHTFPNYIPPIQLRMGLEMQFKFIQFNLNTTRVFEQKFYNPNTDYAPPPSAYFLLNAYFNKDFNKKNRGFQLQLGANNILNTAYRNYLDRFRYFADLPGRSVYLKLKINIHHHELHD